MKYKAKLVATLMTMCLVLSFAVIGILAVKTLNMSVGGNISFTADGVSFTVGNGVFYESNKTTEYTGITSQSGKLQGFAMNTNTKLSDVQDEIATWAGLELNLDSRGDSVLKFNIKNDMSDKQIYVTFAVTLGTNTNNNMNIVAPTTETIVATENKNIEITFDILDMNINAGLKGFKIDITISDTAGGGAASSVVVDKTTGAVTSTSDTKYTNAKYNIVSTTDKTVTVFQSGESITGEVVIADKVKIDGVEYTVTELRVGSFENCTGITSVVIPDSITRIGGCSFKGCNGLTEVVIPDSLTFIGGEVFSNCNNLTNVVIGSGLSNLGDLAFGNCPNMQSITIKATTPPEIIAPMPFYGTTCNVFVPSTALNAYKTAMSWSFIADRIFAISA